MTTETVTSTGIITKTLPELISDLETSFKAIYGNDINLASDSPDAQLLNIIAQAGIDVRELIVEVFNSMSPDYATGATLDQRVAMNGLVRMGGTYTVTPVTITTSKACNLYGLDQSGQEVFTVADDAGNNWQLITTETIGGAGTYVLNFQAENPGAIATVVNTITTPVSIVLGVDTINNPATYTTLGQDEETDEELRLRRSASVSLATQGFLSSLRAALLNLSGVTDVYIYENTTNTTDSDGIPGHSIWVIVGGGSNVDIANAIYNKRNAGCGMKGSISYSIDQVDGTTFVVYWDTVQTENVFIKFTVTSLDDINAPYIETIRAGLLSEYVPSVNETLNINKLGTAVQSLDSNVLVTNSGFCLTSASGSFTNTLSPTAKNYKFTIIDDNIIILPMILKSENGILSVSSGIVYSTVDRVIGGTEQLTGVGGYGTYTYSVHTDGTGCSVDSSTGLYTAGGSQGVDVIRVTDELGNYADCTITVTTS